MSIDFDAIFGFTSLGIAKVKSIPKKSFYDQDGFDTAKKKLFTNHITKIQIIALCDPYTVNIPAYITSEKNYKEILFIEVELKQKECLKKISHIMHQVIPNPIVLLFTFGEAFLLSVATKRLHKQEQNAIVMEDEYISPWVRQKDNEEETQKFVNHLLLKNFSFEHLHTLYSDIEKAVMFSGLIELVGQYVYNKRVSYEELCIWLAQLKELEDKITYFQNEDKRLMNFGDKVTNQQKLLETYKNMNILKQKILCS